MKNNKILLIEICNYSDYPIGGYLSFAKQMLNAFGNQLTIVGMVTDDTPIGVWIKKEIDGIVYDFFAVFKSSKDSRKKIIPGRISVYLAVKKYKKEILSLNIRNIFIQTPEVLLALNIQSDNNLCCRIPGLENPLAISRYNYSKYFAGIFEKIYFKFLKNARIVYATGDNDAVAGYLKRSKGVLDPKKIIKFPSRINTNIFKPTELEVARNILGWDLTKNFVVTSGRLSELKGWKFMLDCFVDYRKQKPNSHFVFLGDGEDKEKIIKYVEEKGITNHVSIPGRVNHQELAIYLNASDLFVMGSYVEGWSTSLVEAISCSKPVVCTDFSSANDLVDHGYNGFVIKNREKKEFVNAMMNCSNLIDNNLLKKAREMKEFSANNLKGDILKYWKLI